MQLKKSLLYQVVSLDVRNFFSVLADLLVPPHKTMFLHKDRKCKTKHVLAFLKTGGRHLGGKSLVFGANKLGKYSALINDTTGIFFINIRLLNVYVVLFLHVTVIKFFHIFACGNIRFKYI